MPTLRAIGFWFGPHASGWPVIEDFIVEDSTQDRNEIAAALDRGAATDRAYMGFSTCRVCGCPNGSGERTNGVLVWPEGLSHYVREHHVRLPVDVEAVLLADESAPADLVAWAISADDSGRDYEWWRSLTGWE